MAQNLAEAYSSGLKASIDAGNEIKNSIQDQESTNTLQQLMNNPDYKGKPMSEVMEAGGNMLLKQGNMKGGLDLLDKSSLMSSREAITKERQQKVVEQYVGDLQKSVSLADDPESLNASLTVLSKLKPDLQPQISKLAMKLNSDPSSFNEIKAKVEEGLKTVSEKLAEKKEAEAEKTKQREMDIKEEEAKNRAALLRRNEAKDKAGEDDKFEGRMLERIKIKRDSGVPLTADEEAYLGISKGSAEGRKDVGTATDGGKLTSSLGVVPLDKLKQLRDNALKQSSPDRDTIAALDKEIADRKSGGTVLAQKEGKNTSKPSTDTPQTFKGQSGTEYKVENERESQLFANLSGPYKEPGVNNIKTNTAVTVAAKEAGIGLENLSILTKDGEKVPSRGTFSNLKNDTIFNASASAAANTFTKKETAQFEALALPLVRMQATLILGTGGDVKTRENLEKSLMQASGAGNREVGYQKIAELTQSVRAGIEAQATNPTLNRSQRETLLDSYRKANAAFPFTPKDVFEWQDKKASGSSQSFGEYVSEKYSKKEQPISPEEFNTKWSSLKPGEHITGPDGKTYTKGQ